jgi:hypothetical protein
MQCVTLTPTSCSADKFLTRNRLGHFDTIGPK